MLNEKELNAIKVLMHSLNGSWQGDLAADVRVIDSNGEALCRVERVGGEYQLIPSDG
jgi:hypothetical protein